MAGRYWPGGQPLTGYPPTVRTAEPPTRVSAGTWPAPVPDIAVVVFYEENSLRLSVSRCTCSCVTTVLSYLPPCPGVRPQSHPVASVQGLCVEQALGGEPMQHDDVIWQVLGPTPPRDLTGAAPITSPPFSLPRR